MTSGCPSWRPGLAWRIWITIVASGGGIDGSVDLDCWGSSVCNPVGCCSITTIMKTMMSTSRTSIKGVTFILGPVENEPPPENPIQLSFRCMDRHARVLIHWTPGRTREFPLCSFGGCYVPYFSGKVHRSFASLRMTVWNNCEFSAPKRVPVESKKVHGH